MTIADKYNLTEFLDSMDSQFAQWTPFHVASEFGNLHLTQYLIGKIDEKSPKSIRKNLSTKNKWEALPLSYSRFYFD